MHLSISMLVLLLFSVSYIAQTEDVKSKIKSKTTYGLTSNSKSHYKVNQTTYNQEGSILNELYFNNEGKISRSSKYKYNEKGLNTKITAFNSKNKIEYEIIKEYNVQNNMVYFKQLSKTGSRIVYQKRTYNDLGQNIKLFTYSNRDSTFMLNYEYSYNANGQYDKIKEYSSYGTSTSYQEFEYDKNENLTANYYVATLGKELKYTITYNSLNQKTEIYHPNKDDKFVDGKLIKSKGRKSTLFKYDNNGNLIKKTTFRQGIQTEEEIYKYETY